MSKAPTRFKPEDELSGDETLAVVRARRAGGPIPRFETDSYRRHRAAALREAGLDGEADEVEDDMVDDLESMTPAQHLRRIQAGRR